MVEIRIIRSDELNAIIPALAQLRMTVFAEYPYLYEGDLAYEERYLSAYRESGQSVIVGVFDGQRLVGAATGTPLQDHDDEFAEAFSNKTGSPELDLKTDRIFYCAESVLLKAYRGKGVGHTFFDLRESHAIECGFTHCCFCAVIRPEDHPAKPQGYRPLDDFWTARGYRKLEGVVARYRWADIGEAHESEKSMQFWLRDLGADGT